MSADHGLSPRRTIDGVTLYRGDCLDVLRTFTDQSFDAVIVDPPYGIGWQSHVRRQRFPKVLNDERPFIWFLHDAYRVTRETGALICFCLGRTQEDFRGAIQMAGWTIRSQVVWDRVQHGMGDCARAFAPQHDVIWFATRRGFRFPGRRPKSVLRFPKVGGRDLLHPTEKPVALMAHLVESVMSPGGHVLDPCMGSGSTGVAAVQCGRRFTGIELDPAWFAVARKRISQANRLRRIP